ncbi:unnamed protein product [Clonostachys chloroleuca]|uniref:Uncharacterized protein n=1 Tax=Clonostachys chloroleuca TaxID=1926264 RepID=A0AA35PZM7_9HYPO|nr:unnamed protein product [Clonostachys chloroleuca]
MYSNAKPSCFLHWQDIKYNHDLYENEFLKWFDVIANEEPNRESFIKALKNKKREAKWDIKIFASAGATFNWADVDAPGRRGIWYCNGAGASDEAVSDTALSMILSMFRNFGGHREGGAS